MGEVYRADDLKLGQPVALKFLPQNLSNNGAALARFHREVRTARQVTHRNVCRVYDIDEVDGQHYLSMEFIKGEELSSLLRRIGRLPADKALEIARQLCAGLAAAHDNGVLHRDLKPANVMIDENGNVRITDFGLAGLTEEFDGEEVRAGTPGYMSPEQLTGKELTTKSDIYSLGLVLYEVFTGKKAFDARTLPELLRLRRGDTTPTNPSSLVKDIDPLVERVILRCIEKEPDDRPSSALQVAAALPGGDPLQAALAAGETPSPEMVAACRTEGSLKPVVAMVLLASAIIGLGILMLLSGKVMLYRQVPLEKSPEGLKDRASDIARKFGYADHPTDHAYGLSYKKNYIRHLREDDLSQARWDKLASGQSAAIYFWHRQSPRYLESFNGRIVTANDPPLTVSGMVEMALDTRGRLIQFEAVPPQVDNSPGQASTAPNWPVLFSEAGLDPANFKPSESRWVPPQPYDTRAAWEGVFPDQWQIPIHVEAAAYHGQPVYFEIITPWEKPLRQEEYQESAKIKLVMTLFFALLLSVMVGAILLAQRNLRLGHGDMKGAFRLALFIFLTHMIFWVSASHHLPTLGGELDVFIEDISSALFWGCFIWLIYIALEPLVRRRWPNMIISWNRLLTGGFRDPLVGRDILIGALFGIGAGLIAYLWVLAPKWMGLPPDTSTELELNTLLGIRGLTGAFSDCLIFSIFIPLAYLFLLLLLTILLRRERVALGVAWFIFALVFDLIGHTPAIDWFFAGLMAGLMILVLTRYGLLAAIFAEFFSHIGMAYPLTLDLSAWYAGSAIFAVAITIALALYGFNTSTGGQPLFKGGFIQD